MKLEYIGKSLEYLNNEPTKTRVVLGNSEGAYYPMFFDKDAIQQTDAELFKRALDAMYEQNFSGRAESEKFNKVDDRLVAQQKAIETTQELLTRVSAVSEILVALAISAQGGMEPNAYAKVAAFLPPLVQDKRYVNNDLVSMSYPYDTNPKWPKGTATLLKFSMQQQEGYTYKGQTVEALLQSGVATVILPKLN